MSMPTAPETTSSPEPYQSTLGSLIADWGSVAMEGLISVGGLAWFTWNTLLWVFTRRPVRRTLLANFYEVGVLSLPVVALTGTFIGMVLAVQSYAQFRQLRLESRLGAVINMSLVRELGPVLAATMLAGRVGSAMAANLGTMRVTEQIDAFACLGVNPIHYLVVPRLLACLIAIPTLTIMADFMGVVGGYFYSVFVLEIDEHFYWENSRQYVQAWDFFSGLIKSVFFGCVIALISCFRGFHCGAGAEGVGKAATAAFVHSFVLILSLDLFLNIALESVYTTLWPEAGGFL